MGDRRLWLASAAFIASLGAMAVVFRPPNHDVSWYLHMAGVMLNGGTAYVDVVDTNPPLIVMLTMVPVWTARLLGLAPAWAFYAGVFLLAVLSCVWCGRLIMRAWPGASSAAHGLLAVGVVFLLLAFPKGDFGQREHLTVILAMPYVLAAAVRSVGGSLSTGEAILTGVAGAMGFALKPHFLLAWVAVEIAILVHHRRQGSSSRRALALRAECVAAVCTFVVYGIATLMFFPEYLDVARRVWAVYGGLDSPTARLIALREWQIGLVALALVALIRLPRDLAAPLTIVGAGAAGFLASSLLQLKGWGYHMLPAQVFLALVFLVLVVSVIQASPALASFIRGGPAAIMTAVALVLTVLSMKYVYEARQPVSNDTLRPLAALVREHAPEGPIAVLSMRTLVYPAFPLVNQTGARWSLRHHSLWFLPAFYGPELTATGPGMMALHTPAQMPPLERAFYDEIIDDLCTLPPRLLVIERASPLAPAGRRALDLESYYGQDPRFARLFGAFRVQSDVGPFMVYKAISPPVCSSGSAFRFQVPGSGTRNPEPDSVAIYNTSSPSLPAL
jgi:hypothetical protein